MRTPAVLLFLLLCLAPTLPPAAAQGSTPPALVALFDDSFDQDLGWAKPNAAPTANGWHRTIDRPQPQSVDPRVERTVMYAGKLTGAGGDPAGYDNSVTLRLTSPAITIPQGFHGYSIVVVARGSSEQGADLLRVQMALGNPAIATNFQTLASYSGQAREASYGLLESSSTLLQGADGQITVRLEFASDASCPSAPALADTLQGCEASLGWLIDRILVVGKRDFVEAAGPSAARLALDAHGQDLAIDLIRDRGDLVEFRLDEQRLATRPEEALVRLTRVDSQDLLAVSLARQDTGVWTGLLAVDEPDLVTGAWVASFYSVVDGSGSIVSKRGLEVRATDAVPPLLRVQPASTGTQPVQLGPGDTLEVTVAEALLRRVTYTYDGLPTPAEMHSPYVLQETALPEGRTNVTFAAADRNGNSHAVRVLVDRDTTPPAARLDAPDKVYADVPFLLGLNVTERSAHTVRVDAGGTLTVLEVPAGRAAGGNVTGLQVTAPELGPFTVELRVNDTVGNDAVVVRHFDVVEPVTDLEVSSARLASPTTNVQREGQTIVATLRQATGVAPLPVVVTFEGAGRTASFNVTVPANGTADVTWNATLPLGQHLVRVSAVGPEAANETAPGNEQSTLAVEVFAGRITDGTDVYTIRTDARGLPTQAVLAGSTRTFPLVLVNTAQGVAYSFSPADGRTLVWDPLEPVQDAPQSESSTSSGAGKGAPGPGLLLAAAALGLAGLALRRRR